MVARKVVNAPQVVQVAIGRGFVALTVRMNTGLDILAFE